MHPDFALRRLADRVRPHEDELPTVGTSLTAVERRLARAFPTVAPIFNTTLARNDTASCTGIPGFVTGEIRSEI